MIHEALIGRLEFSAKMKDGSDRNLLCPLLILLKLKSISNKKGI